MATERDQLRPMRRQPWLSGGQRWLLRVFCASLIYGALTWVAWALMPWVDKSFGVGALVVVGTIAYATGRWHEHRAERFR